MEENKKIIMTGIPGVGKTTLLSKIVEIIKSHGKSVNVVSFGTMMFEIAKENGLKDRDELRKLSVTEQQNLQKIVAEKIAALNDQIVIIDTHAFINSPEGYYPGLPEHVLKIIKPTNFVSVSAKSEEIYNRRMKDDTRNRDKITLINIKKELEYQSGMISACVVITGSPVRHILNNEGKVDEAVDKVISSIGL
ncbi:MAG: adenylate kinase [Nitrosopumilus sp.]|nr:adenylate kinase [Nitrosopumilus sp.]